MGLGEHLRSWLLSVSYRASLISGFMFWDTFHHNNSGSGGSKEAMCYFSMQNINFKNYLMIRS